MKSAVVSYAWTLELIFHIAKAVAIVYILGRAGQGYGNQLVLVKFLLSAVPRKGFGSTDCDTIYTIYPSVHNQQVADPNPFKYYKTKQKIYQLSQYLKEYIHICMQVVKKLSVHSPDRYRENF